MVGVVPSTSEVCTFVSFDLHIFKVLFFFLQELREGVPPSKFRHYFKMAADQTKALHRSDGMLKFFLSVFVTVYQ